MPGKAVTVLWIVVLFCSLTAKAIPVVRLQPGMVIRESVIISRESYLLNAPVSLSGALITIEGKDIVVDFDQAILQGSNDKSRPDEMYGLALRIRKGSGNITIRNAVIRGYKVAILAENVDNLVIDHCDLSYNWRQHLQSNREREDLSDWMSFHKNENNEWLRYGAAIYLQDCKKATITNNMVTGGQCALLLTRCEKTEVSDNDFSFNSGIGIGLYRSSNNRVYHNRLDYNVRGFSYGKYKRGQDSAGILVFEQSNDNVFAFNTATHSGDGFFLWAGQSTLDSGKGGCNDNFIYGNDFSYAPTNGVEVTFSRNLIMKNLIKECDHGIWGGYSFDTDITDNVFADNRIGIAIEHGQNINIALNSFTGEGTGIKLWSREKQPADWAYARLRNTESRNYWIAANRFTSTKTAFDIMGTDTVVFSGNTKLMVENNLVLGDRVANIDTSREEEFLDMDYQKDERLKTLRVDQRPQILVPQGKKEMRITEWGPYDFRYPMLWLQQVDSSGTYHFEVLGAGGVWEPGTLKGFTITGKGVQGFPSFLTAKADSTVTERSIEVQYTGPSFSNIFGKRTDSGRQTSFAYAEFDPHAVWDTRWYSWTGTSDPARGFAEFSKVFEQPAVHSAVTREVDYTWWGAIGKNLPADSFATEAVSKMILKEGDYLIGVTADDYAKVFIDGKEVIDAWDAGYTQLDENTHHRAKVHLQAGEHIFRIVHAEVAGLATLLFYIKPA